MYDCVVIGAGPAGLSAAAALHDQGLRLALLERGPELKNRTRSPLHLTSGVGGAGLYSDGKFSFRPSASQLWGAEPSGDIEQSERWLMDRLRAVGWERPSSPDLLATAGRYDKAYPSFYVPPDVRYRLIDSLTPGDVRVSVDVVGLAWLGDEWQIKVSGPDGESILHSSTVILGVGRFGLQGLYSLLPSSAFDFKRVELGLRLEQPADDFIFRKHPQLDPKLIVPLAGGSAEFRTFCTCRNGLVVETETDGLKSLSGRADCAPTGRSNLGLLVRLLDESAMLELEGFLGRLAELSEPVAEDFTVFAKGGHRSRAATLLGKTVTAGILQGLATAGLLDALLGARDTVVHAPAIEGLGMYPRLRPDLRAEEIPMWVAGDASGAFRGLVAAMVSGYFCGLQVARNHDPSHSGELRA